ncbi:hypothetical protein MKW92_033736 [Papaver armeniacum]|nr:hypothetical protein MKW92_033736 [Papaver armeniacum]
MGSSISSPASGTLENETSKLEEKEPHSSSTVSNGTNPLENQDQTNPIPVSQDQASVSSNGGKREGEECGLYSLLKEGACKDNYNAYEDCLKQGIERNEDVNVKCRQLMSSFHDCVIAHPEYYEPALKAACWFMEAGECKDTFTAWQNCMIKAAVEADEEDVFGKCRQVGSLLHECMVAHPDHYGPVLRGLQDDDEQSTEEEEDEEAVMKKVEMFIQNLEKLVSEN